MTIRPPLRNWAGNVAFAARALHRPTSVEQLRDLVARTPRIRALGTGHSFSRVADTEGDLVTVAGLDGTVGFDEATGVLSVPAGARYGEILPHLAGHGRALANLGSLPHIAVGGAVATATHGSGRANRCLAASVIELDLVRADGELVTLTTADADLAGAVVALGALGIVIRLGLATRPAFAMRQDVWCDAPRAAVLERFDTIMDAGHSVSLFIAPGGGEVVDQIWVKSEAGAAAVDGRAWGAHAAAVAMHPIAGQDARACTPQLGEVRPWAEILPHFRLGFMPSSGDEQQSEYYVAWADAPAALAAVLALDLDEALQVMEIRSVAADDLWLSPAHDRDTVTVHFTWHDRDDAVRRACRAVEQVLRPFAPRPHWGKVHTLPADEVREQYPRLADFRLLASAFDPGRKFGNRFLDAFVL